MHKSHNHGNLFRDAKLSKFLHCVWDLLKLARIDFIYLSLTVNQISIY